MEGLDRDRFAILSKTHHALVDGVSGLDILSVLFAPDEEESWAVAARACALLRRAGDRGALRARDERRRAVRPLGVAARHPRKTVSRITETLVGAGALAWAACNRRR